MEDVRQLNNWEIEKDGKVFTATSVLAVEFGYDRNHIGLLARQGKVRGLKIDKRWFVERESLERHKAEVENRKVPESIIPRRLNAPSSALSRITAERAGRALKLALTALFIFAIVSSVAFGKNDNLRKSAASLIQNSLPSIKMIQDEAGLTFRIKKSDFPKAKDDLENLQAAIYQDYLSPLLDPVSYVWERLFGREEENELAEFERQIRELEERLLNQQTVTVQGGETLVRETIREIIREVPGTFIVREVPVSSPSPSSSLLEQRLLSLEEYVNQRFSQTPTILVTSGGGGNQGVTVMNPALTESETVKVSSLLDVSGSAEIDGATTIGGNLTIDTNTFFVDSTNNRVGVLTTSPETAFEVVGVASISQIVGAGLTNCDADNQTLAWNSTNKTFSCGDDDSGGEGSAPKTEEGGVQKLANSSIFNFDIGGFALTASGTTETIIAIDYVNGPASRSIAQTITGKWTFGANASLSAGNFGINSGGTIDTRLEVGGSASISGQFTFGNNSATGAIDTSDWDISSTGALTGIAFDANATGNSITNIDNADLSADTLDFTAISDTPTLDASLNIGRAGFFIGLGAAPSTVFEVQGTSSASYFLTGNTLQVGGFASAAYSRFGIAATDHAGSITTTNDVLISGDLEVDASAAFDGILSFFGEIAPDGITCSNGQILKRTAANDWDCASDATGGGGGAGIEVKETGVFLDVSVASISFHPAHFNVTASGSEDVLVKIDYTDGPASRTAAQTISGAWTFSGLTAFSGGASSSTGFEITTGNLGINAGNVTDTRLEVGGTASISGQFTLGNNSATGAIDTSDWDISTTGAITGVAFDANGAGNSITNIDNADLSADTLDFTAILDNPTLDANLNISRSGFFIGLGAAPSTVFEVQGTASASYLLTGNTLQVGGFSSAAYSRFGTLTTGHSNYISATNDVLISGDLEVKGSISANIASASRMFISNPTASASLSFRGNGSGGANQSLFSIGVGNGTERLDIFNNANSPLFTIASSGNVGIGTTSPAAMFEVASLSSSVFAVSKNGRVGIGGNTLPSAKLIITGNLDIPTFIAKNNTNRTGDVGTFRDQGSLLLDGTHSKDILQVEFLDTSSIPGVGTADVTGNILNVFRDLTSFLNDTVNLTGAVARFDDKCAEDSGGICNSTAAVVEITQNYTANTGSALNITSAATGTGAKVLRVSDDGTFSDLTPFVVDTSGRVGVMTASPSTVFEVQGTASASYLLTGNTLQVGGFASAAYSRFGTLTTGHSNYISATNDVLISGDLEVKGSISANIASASRMFISNPTASASLSFRGNGSGGANQSLFSIGVGNGTERLDIFNNANSPLFTIASSGNVGIGTTGPTTTLDISGSASVSSQFEVGTLAAASATHVCRNASNVLSTCSSSTEWAPALPENDIEEGDIVVIDSATPNPYGDKRAPFVIKKSDQPQQTGLMGYVTDPALGGDGVKLNEHYRPVGIIGYWPVKVNLENGPIKRGDRITSSSSSGVGMKATEAGMVVGIALEDVDSIVSGSYVKIKTFTNLGYWSPAIQTESLADSSAIFDLDILFNSIVAKFYETMNIVFENGLVRVAQIFTDKLTAKEVAAEKLCVGSTCVTEQELKALLETNQINLISNYSNSPNEAPITNDQITDTEVIDTASESFEPMPESTPESAPNTESSNIQEFQSLNAEPEPSPVEDISTSQDLNISPEPEPTTEPAPTPTPEPEV